MNLVRRRNNAYSAPTEFDRIRDEINRIFDTDEHEERDGAYYHRERWSGSFQRSVTLPDAINPDKVKAEMKDGVLRITFPKRDEVKPKQISVKSA
jgi:HSP20 family molecular chaperone IbpA